MVGVVGNCVLFYTGSDKVVSSRGLQKEFESHSPDYLLKFVLGTAMLCSLEVIRMELSGAVCNPAVEVVGIRAHLYAGCRNSSVILRLKSWKIEHCLCALPAKRRFHPCCME